MENRIFDPDKTKLDELGAKIIADGIKRLLKNKLFVVLAIPGGRSVGGIFSSLAKMDIPWESVHIFMVDERLVSPGHVDSNFRLANEAFISELVKKGILHDENVHSFLFYPESPDLGVGEYRKQLEQWGGSFDIVLLSSGEDGHVGALFPNHGSIKDNAHYFIAMHDSVKPPKDRMTSSRKLLMRSKIAVILFYDEIKHGALKLFGDPKTPIEACPAKLVKTIEECYVLTNIS